MEGAVWYTSPDGTLSIASFSRNRIEETMGVIEKSFYNEENVCKVLGIPDDPIAKQDLNSLCLEAAEDGISFIALDKTETSEGKVVGFVINKLQVNVPEPSFFEKHFARCKSQNGKDLIKIMIDIDAKCGIFDKLKINCIAEIMFMGILPQYTNKKLGSLLGRASLERLLFLKFGLNLKEDLDGKPSVINPIPEGVSFIYSSKYIKQMWNLMPDKSRSVIPIEIPYKDFFRNRKHFDEVIDTTIHEKIGVVYFDFNQFTEKAFDDYFSINGLAKREYIELARRNAFGLAKKTFLN